MAPINSPHGEVLPAGSLEPRRRLDENWDPELRWHGHWPALNLRGRGAGGRLAQGVPVV